MQVLAVFIIALPKLLEEVADGHLGHVVLVEELAIVTLLAEVPQPVLADDGPLASHMTKRAVCSTTT